MIIYKFSQYSFSARIRFDNQLASTASPLCADLSVPVWMLLLVMLLATRAFTSTFVSLLPNIVNAVTCVS